ncbi:MAG: RsmG family class I SAM-dependent methyltransferase, partial [Candidatus Kapaibacterium sp.]
MEALAARAEALATQHRFSHKFDTVVTRAVAPLDELCVWSRDLLKKGGMILALKGGNLEEEKKKVQGLKFVRSVEEGSLKLEGYDEFMKEEKKIVRVTMV